MAILPVLIHPHPALRVCAQTVDSAQLHSLNMRRLIDDMIETMRVKDGVGIAATQVGKPYQIFIVSEIPKKVQVFINPELSVFSKKQTYLEEGCLSLPGILGWVARPAKVRLKALDLSGQPVEIKATGLMAKIVQHEYDHLQGILFIDKTERLTQGNLVALERGEALVASVHKKHMW